ncbi:MAG: secretin N-terminal domain-containing protein [Planctomycetaceae bacterium]
MRVSFDARSNSLIVSAPEASMGLMEALVRVLDQAPAPVLPSVPYWLRAPTRSDCLSEHQS